MEYCALTFNGQLLDEVLAGYMTVNVEGRGLIDQSIKTVDIEGRDGSFILGQRLPAREIKVFFALIAENAVQKQERLSALNKALVTKDDAKFSFGDEDYYRYGRLSLVQEPPYDQLQGIGSFSLYCQDPYKYKEPVTLSGTSITLPSGPSYPYKLNELQLITPTSNGLTINNTSTGRKIVLTGSFDSGQVLKIYPDSILLNGQNIMNRLDFINSDWKEFELHHGNVITAPTSMTLSVSERSL